MEWLLSYEIWAALLTLTVLEIVLGIDNLIFLSIIVSRLPAHQQAAARNIGLAGACITRILLLFSLSWLAGLVTPLFTVLDEEISGRDLVLIGGGLFLLYKAVSELHEQMEGSGDHVGPDGAVRAAASFGGAIVTIMLVDIVFSLDSVITAIGMTDRLPVMVTAIIIAVGVMILFAAPLSRFVDRHPTVKVLALAFLIMVGAALVAEGLDFHIPRGYMYFAMAFSVGVEMYNLRLRRKQTRPTPSGD